MSLTLFSLYIGYLSKSSDISSMFSPSRAGQIKCDISIDCLTESILTVILYFLCVYFSRESHDINV